MSQLRFAQDASDNRMTVIKVQPEHGMLAALP
jgi:hypothetical protein